MKYFVLTAFVSLLSFGSYAQDQQFELDTIYNPAKGTPKNIALIYFGGSEGGLPTWEDMDFQKKELPKMGIATLGVAYFGSEQTPKNLEKLPLEYWEAVIEQFTNRPEITGKKIVVDGISKGGELALLMGSLLEGIDGVIAKAPSHVAWQGITWENVSSWTYGNQEIPFVPYYKDYDYESIKEYEYLMSYTLALTQQQAVAQATIKVEKIKAPILLFSGESDEMWPSTLMAEIIKKRLDDVDFKYPYSHYHFKRANHSFNPDSKFGTAEANKHAYTEMNNRIVAFLTEINSQ